MKPEEIDFIVVHCAATRANMDIGFAEIDRWHKDRGWSGCGYHIVIRRNGAIELGRSLQTPGAHAYGYNRRSWGICLAGGLDQNNEPEANYTTKQYDSLKSVILGMSYRAPQAEILGHRDLSEDVDGDGVIEPFEWMKPCPCFDVGKWWREVHRVI